MKKQITYGLMAATVLMWNCKPTEIDAVDTPTTAVKHSSARIPAPPKAWDLTLGGSGIDILTVALNNPTTSGGYIFGGSSNSPISRGSNDRFEAYGGNDYWVVKVTEDGTFKHYNRAIGGSGEDRLASIVPLSDMTMVLGGSSNSPAEDMSKSQGSKGGYDYWIVKVNRYGNVIWDKVLGGTNEDHLTSMVATNDGGFLVGGISASLANKVTPVIGNPLGGIGSFQPQPISSDKSMNSCNGSYDYWIVKLDVNGKKQWDITLGNGGNDYLASVVKATDGGYLLAGYSSSEGLAGNKTAAGKGGYDYWVVKIDANGNKQWDKTFGGTQDDQLAKAAATPDGGFVLGGSSSSPAGADKTEGLRGAAGQNDYWVVKIDANGNKQWDKTVGSPGDDTFKSLAVTADGGIWLGGETPSAPGGEKIDIPKGVLDYWIAKLEADGRYLGQDKTLGGTATDKLGDILVTADGGIIAAGSSQSQPGGISDKSERPKGIMNYWVVKLK